MNYNSSIEIKNILTEFGFTPQKRFGQNFLISESVRSQIVSILELDESSSVWEIGPGLGAMTEMILKKLNSGFLTVFEIDRGFSTFLRENFCGNIEIVEGDMLKTWKKHYSEKGMPDRIFGNLPYNAASVMIAGLIEAGAMAERMVFTVQKEVAVRMTALPGRKDYSSFSVLCQSACDVSLDLEISGSSFYPAPEVVSAVVTMKRPEKPLFIPDRKNFSSFLRILFGSRRKTVLNNLKKYGKEVAASVLEEAEIFPGIRADNLPVEEIVRLYGIVKKKYSDPAFQNPAESELQ